jgi:transcriptional regulator with XRE-family HTH domain
MKDSTLKYGQTLDEFIAEEIAENPGFAEKLQAAEEEVQFAVELARLREARGFTQKALAEVLGMKQPMLARLERGQRPTVPTLQRLAQALGGEFTIGPDGGLKVKQCRQWTPPPGVSVEPRLSRKTRRKKAAAGT